jgi:cystathionine beta-lyase/cystathionine gamma-synthase
VVDFSDLERVAQTLARLRPKLIYFETPGNPTLAVVDIAAVSRWRNKRGR